MAQHIGLVQTPSIGNFQLLMMDYYHVFLPVSLLLIAVDHQIASILILAIHLILFPGRMWHVLKDLLNFLRYELITKII